MPDAGSGREPVVQTVRGAVNAPPVKLGNGGRRSTALSLQCFRPSPATPLILAQGPIDDPAVAFGCSGERQVLGNTYGHTECCRARSSAKCKDFSRAAADRGRPGDARTSACPAARRGEEPRVFARAACD